MTLEERQKLRDAAVMAAKATPPRTSVERVLSRWEVQTSNSFRRIGCHGDGDVLCAITQRSDNHPDLHAPPGVLDYIVAAQPRVVLALLDQLDEAEQQIARTTEINARLDEADRKFSEVQKLVERLQASWNKEAERHEKDHQAHYEEREVLRAALNEVLNIVETIIAETTAEKDLIVVFFRQRLAKLRRAYEEGTLTTEVKR